MVADMAVAATAFAVAQALGASPKVMLSLFEAGYVESEVRNLNYGADDSVGWLQQRPSQGWPNPMDVRTSTTSFVTRAKASEAKNPSQTAGQLAQSVQRSAFPDKYDKREADARALITKLGGTPPGNLSYLAAPTGNPLSGVGDLTDGVAGIAGALKTMATGVVNVGGLATQLMKLALPSNVVRAVTGGLGVILIFTGIIILGRQIRG